MISPRIKWVIAAVLAVGVFYGIWFALRNTASAAVPTGGGRASAAPAPGLGALEAPPVTLPGAEKQDAKAMQSALGGPATPLVATDCPSLMEAHRLASTTCMAAPDPRACIGDALRAAAYQPEAVDLCKLFRPTPAR